MKILFATGNESKAKRFNLGLSKHDIEVLSLKDVDIDIDVEENGKDAIENALIKARAYAASTDMVVMAMDDNLYLDNVPEEYQPGMYVRRVNGKRLDDDEMIEHYISLVKKYGIDGKLVARWVYGMAVIKDGKEYTYTWNKDDFYMVDKVSSVINPGYPLNSISKVIETDRYFSEISDEEKQNSKNNEDHVVNFIVSCFK